jgi:hypothetical protein
MVALRGKRPGELARRCSRYWQAAAQARAVAHDGRRGNLVLVMFEAGNASPGPFFFQPNPEKCLFVPARAEKLVRRGPGEYSLIGRKPDGRQVEARLTAATFKMEGI